MKLNCLHNGRSYIMYNIACTREAGEASAFPGDSRNVFASYGCLIFYDLRLKISIQPEIAIGILSINFKHR